MGTRIQPAVVEAIKAAGLTKAAYIRRVWPDGEWRGDVCGCTDDRCIGYHHDEDEECTCVLVLIEQAVDEQLAARS